MCSTWAVSKEYPVWFVTDSKPAGNGIIRGHHRNIPQFRRGHRGNYNYFQLGWSRLLPIAGHTNRVSTLVGQNMGAKNPDGAEQATYSGFKLALTLLEL